MIISLEEYRHFAAWRAERNARRAWVLERDPLARMSAAEWQAQYVALDRLAADFADVSEEELAAELAEATRAVRAGQAGSSIEGTVSSDAAPSGIIAVLDINALVRVMLAKSPLVRALRDSLESGAFILLTSDEILAELDRVLRYPRIFARHALTEDAIQEFEQSIRKIAVSVPGLYAVSKIEADPSDDKFLVCALEGAADYIVSDDPHLRDLKDLPGDRDHRAGTVLRKAGPALSLNFWGLRTCSSST